VHEKRERQNRRLRTAFTGKTQALECRLMSPLPHDLAIPVIAIVALGFLLLGIFYSTIAYHLGLEEGTSGHRFYSILVGLALLLLLLVYHVAKDSLAI
jgi:hypothetical protein